MKKFIFVAFVNFYLIENSFGNEYWRTRNLSGSDYEVDYNLNRSIAGSKSESKRKNNQRFIFDWNSKKINSASRNSNTGNEIKINAEENRNNIWWPWSSYDEWAQARTQNSTKNKKSSANLISTNSRSDASSSFIISTATYSLTSPTTIVPISSTKSSDERKRRRKGKKRRNRKRKKLREQTTAMSNSILDHLQGSSTPSTFFGRDDNNEMDNEIRPMPAVYNSYNSYNSIPVVDMRKFFEHKIKKNRTLNKYSKEYSTRNFSDDVNECLVNNGGCEGLCINTPGSYKCHCPDGFRVDGTKCIDVNECLLRNGHGPCQDICVNNWGSYKCSCENISGSTLASDGHTCEDIDECKEGVSGCSHECINTFGSAFCLCPKGFMLGLDWKTCEDIDECAMPEMQEIPCGYKKCLNTVGSYECLN